MFTFGGSLRFVERSDTSLHNKFRTFANVSGRLNVELVPYIFINKSVNHSFVLHSIGAGEKSPAFVLFRERVPNSFPNL